MGTFFVNKDGYLLRPDFSNDEKVVLPSNTKIIGDYAFSNWVMLKEIKLPEGIIKIGDNAFCGCYSLCDIVLPETLREIGSSAFSNCLGLEYIKMPESVDYIKEILFYDCQNLKKVDLSSKTTSIGDFAFKNCYKLQQINLPDSIERIGTFAFINCNDLENISLPKNITKISSCSFVACLNLKRIKMPSKVKVIEEYAFSNCISLKEIYLNRELEVIEKGAFEECDNIVRVEIENCFNLMQPGLKNRLSKINYAYKEIATGKLLLTSEKLQDVNGKYKELNFKGIQENLSCSKEEAILISTRFTLEEIKENKIGFMGPIVNYIMKDSKDYSVIENISKNNKEFFNLYKRLKLDIYVDKKLISQDNMEFYLLFSFAYSLGAFSENYIDRQKACEFIGGLFEENLLDIYNIASYFHSMRLEIFKKEWAEFVMEKGNRSNLFGNNIKNKAFISKIYNNFENIQEFNRSNKGNQRLRKVNYNVCERYFSENKFVGVSVATKDIADEISKFVCDQNLFDEAKRIREEYMRLKSESNVDDHIIGESICEKINEERSSVCSEVNSIIGNLREVSSKFTYEFLSKNDAANFVLGRYCNCCANIDSCGYSIMRASIIHPDCQNLVIRDKNGRIIAKSTIYVNKKEGYALFNNISVSESVLQKDKKELFSKYNAAIKRFISLYNQKNQSSPIRQVNVGMGNNKLENEIREVCEESDIILKGIDFSVYGNNGQTHEGDWRFEQRVLWKEDEKPIK